MADNQAKLLTPPPGHNNLQQPVQLREELAVNLDLVALSVGGTVAEAACSGSPPQLDLALRRGFLLGYGIMDAL